MGRVTQDPPYVGGDIIGQTRGSNTTWATNPDLINAGANTTPYRTSPLPHASTPTFGLLGSGSGLINGATNNIANYTRQAAQNYNPPGGTGGNGYGGGYGGGSGSNYGAQTAYSPIQAIWDAIQAQRQQAIAAANAALDRQAEVARARYKSSKKQIGRNYQDLRNQHSVNNFKAGKAQREALADRGALGSGPGLQERLTLSANYNNGLNKINTQEQSAFEELLNNLNQYLAQIDMQKAANEASGMDNYMNLLSTIGNFAGYTPGDAYNQLAQSLAGQQQAATPVATASTGAAGLTMDDYYNTLLRQYGAR